MTLRLAPYALLLATPAFAQTSAPEPQPLSIQQATALRCSAAFAAGAALQARGEGREWPLLAKRGQEFFVRTSAAIMDATGRSRDRVAIELREQARALAEPGKLAATMPPCLLLLDASGL